MVSKTKSKKKSVNLRILLVIFVVSVFGLIMYFLIRPTPDNIACTQSGRIWFPNEPKGQQCKPQCQASVLCDMNSTATPCTYKRDKDNLLTCMNCEAKRNKAGKIHNYTLKGGQCTQTCANNQDCENNQMCLKEELDNGISTQICVDKQWWGIETPSQTGSYFCKAFDSTNTPKGTKHGPYSSLKECAEDQYTSKESSQGTGLKNNKCKGSFRLNAQNTDCNTLPCTNLGKGGWGSSRPQADNKSYVYQPPIGGNEQSIGTCFKTWTKDSDGNELATAPQVPDGDSECNSQKTEQACREKAYLSKDYQVPHCKWYPAGSCQRYSKWGKGYDFYNAAGAWDKGKKRTGNDAGDGFFASKSLSGLNADYPKLLDWDPSISNCRHKLIEQGATTEEATKLCGKYDDGGDFNPLEFRRCAGIIANKYGEPTFHTSMYPFLETATDKKGVKTHSMVVTLGSRDGKVGVSKTLQYCARGGTCAGRDQDAINFGIGKNVGGQKLQTTLFPVVDTYCKGCTRDISCDDGTCSCGSATCWCRPYLDDNSFWSTSKKLKKATIGHGTGIDNGANENCINTWYKNEACEG